jgi:hypothetical protein
MITFMKNLLSLAGALMLGLCLAMPAAAQDGPSQTRRFSGVYVNGWEVQLFIENGRDNEQPYWIAMTPEARAAIAVCYVQGLESLACLIERDGRLEKIGVQAFPG